MGLSASQARLLSLTSRISQNELRSEQTTRAKQALAQETAQISKKYLNALNEQELTYAIYDQDGDKTSMALTGTALSKYAPLKNQYALINANGQVLVSELDAANYEDSADVNEFLSHYGLDPIPTGEYKTVKNPEYDGAYAAWKEGYDEWVADKPDPNDEKYWSEQPQTDFELYNKFITAVTQCGCWWGEDRKADYQHIEHILAKMIDYDTTFTAYPGTDKEVTYHKIGKDEITIPNTGQGGSIEQTNPWYDSSEEIMIEVRQKIKESTRDPELWQDIVNMYYEVVKTTPMYSRWEPRIDDALSYIDSYDNGAPPLSMEEIENEVYDADESDGWDSLIERLKYAFTEPTFDEDAYNNDLGEWETHEPEALDVPATVEEEIYKYGDTDEAQWYVNLWHRMNGESQEKDGYTTFQSSTVNTLSGKFTNQKRWDILEDGLMNNEKWLKYALESGAVTIERVEFADPNEMSTGIRKTKWNSIIYTNALDISSQQNQKKIAQAEAEFDRKQKMIESKDKQYDSILKLLDTEHNALEQEYESAKSVISKNTERTLKIYS